MPAAAPGSETPGGETTCSSFQPPGCGRARICPEPGRLLRRLGKELAPLDRQSLKQSQREPGHRLFWLGTPGESQEGQLCPVFGPSSIMASWLTLPPGRDPWKTPQRDQKSQVATSRGGLDPVGA